MSGWRVEHGDSLKLLCELPSGSVDAVVTDPPYSSGGPMGPGNGGSAKAKYLSSERSIARLPDFFGDSRSERGLLLRCSLWMAEAWRVAKEGAAIAVFCDWRSFPTMSDALQAGGWVWRGTGVWIKPPGRSRPVKGGLWNDTEYILWGSRGARTEGEYLPGTWQVAAPSSSTRLHVTEKPQEVLQDLVRLAPEGGVVLDPFCGSGSTGVAALAQGREFIGFELSPDYAAIARERLELVERSGADVAQSEPTLWG